MARLLLVMLLWGSARAIVLPERQGAIDSWASNQSQQEMLDAMLQKERTNASQSPLTGGIRIKIHLCADYDDGMNPECSVPAWDTSLRQKDACTVWVKPTTSLESVKTECEIQRPKMFLNDHKLMFGNWHICPDDAPLEYILAMYDASVKDLHYEGETVPFFMHHMAPRKVTAAGDPYDMFGASMGNWGQKLKGTLSGFKRGLEKPDSDWNGVLNQNVALDGQQAERAPCDWALSRYHPVGGATVLKINVKVK